MVDARGKPVSDQRFIATSEGFARRMGGEAGDEQIHFTGDQHQARTPFVGLKIREWKFD